MEAQNSGREIVAVMNAGISRLQIFEAFGLDLYPSLFVISCLTSSGEIHHWV